MYIHTPKYTILDIRLYNTYCYGPVHSTLQWLQWDRVLINITDNESIKRFEKQFIREVNRHIILWRYINMSLSIKAYYLLIPDRYGRQPRTLDLRDWSIFFSTVHRNQRRSPLTVGHFFFILSDILHTSGKKKEIRFNNGTMNT